MSEKQQIEYKVWRLRRVRRWQLVLDYAVRGLFWGACTAALLLLATKLWIMPVSMFALGRLPGEFTLGLALLLLATTGFAISACFRKLSPLSVANDIDVRLGLRERVSSALALDPANEQTRPFVQ